MHGLMRGDRSARTEDCYSFLALYALGKAIIEYHAGKHKAREFLTDLRARVLGAPIMSIDAFLGLTEPRCRRVAVDEASRAQSSHDERAPR